MKVREFLKRYENGSFRDDEDQIRAGWYDWACDESELPKRLAILYYHVLKDITNPLLLDSYYIWFENRRNADGELIDEIRLSPADASRLDELYFWIECSIEGHGLIYVVRTARSRYKPETAFPLTEEALGLFLKAWPETGN